MGSTKPGTFDKRLLRAYGSVLLVVKTRMKIYGNRLATQLSGAQHFYGINSPSSDIVMEYQSNLASSLHVPKSLPDVLL
jgi:hypothetical protein